MNKPIRDQRGFLALCSDDYLVTMVSFRHRAPVINGHSPLLSSATSPMVTAFTILCIHHSIRLLPIAGSSATGGYSRLPMSHWLLAYTQERLIHLILPKQRP